MEKQKLKDLSPLQIGKYSEYIAKMEFILYGFDVYSPELDDKGIDFIVRKDDSFYFDIQVKAVRDFNYIYFQKSKFQIRENLYAFILIYRKELKPSMYLIPSNIWNEPNKLFVSRDYKGKKSVPEFVINLSEKNLAKLNEFLLEKSIENILKQYKQ